MVVVTFDRDPDEGTYEYQVQAGAMTIDQAVSILDAMDRGDNEAVHIDADAVLMSMVPEPVLEAYDRLRHRVNFWYA